MTCPRSSLLARCFGALLVAALCGLLAVERASATLPPVFLPLIQPNQPPAPQLGPPAAVRVRAELSTAPAGQPVMLTATLLDAAGNALPPAPDLDVFLSVGGRDLLADRIAGAAGPFTYSAAWTPPAAGAYVVSAVATQRADGAKAGLPVFPFTLTVAPGAVAALDLAAHTYAAVALPNALAVTLYDAAGNAIPNPLPGSVACVSDDPAVQTGAVQPLSPSFYSDAYRVSLDGSRHQLAVPLTADAYGVATVTCTHAPSGASDALEVAAAPWELRLFEQYGTPDPVYLPGTPLAMHMSIRTPAGVGWQRTAIYVERSSTQFTDGGCDWFLQLSGGSCQYTEQNGGVYYIFNLRTDSTFTGLIPTARIGLQAPFYPPTPITPMRLTLTDLDLFAPEGEITYDADLFDPWRTITVTTMIPQAIPIHIFTVAGSADVADVQADLARAQRAFAVNRAACQTAFALQPTMSEIPADEWSTLDADGDGFDHWAGGGDDFAAAAAAGYADADPEAINVYYVPQVRGAPALVGSGKAVALQGASGDHWALFHLLVHALDRRADGSADLAHGPGAPGNALNGNLPGPFLTPEQCTALQP